MKWIKLDEKRPRRAGWYWVRVVQNTPDGERSFTVVDEYHNLLGGRFSFQSRITHWGSKRLPAPPGE